MEVTPSKREELSGGEWFPFVLSKLGSLQFMSLKTESDGVSAVVPEFCFAFWEDDPTVHARLHDAVQSYVGAVRWELYSGMDGTCLGAVPQPSTYYAPMLDVGTFTRQTEHFTQDSIHPDPRFVAMAVADIPTFCRHLEAHLGLVGVEPKPFMPGESVLPRGWWGLLTNE